MGHKHEHANAQGHDHGRGYDHSAVHFRSCTNPDACYCEVIRFALASACITIAIAFQVWFLRTYTASYGGEGDVSHSFADNLYYLALIPLTLYKRSHKEKASGIELFGFCLNTVLLLFAAGYILFRLVFGDQSPVLQPWAIATVGAIGLAGNLGQFAALGQVEWKGTSNIKGAAQHVAYDAANSAAVILDAAVIYLIGGIIGLLFDQVVAFIIALSMLYTCWKNWERIEEKLFESSQS